LCSGPEQGAALWLCRVVSLTTAGVQTAAGRQAPVADGYQDCAFQLLVFITVVFHVL